MKINTKILPLLLIVLFNLSSIYTRNYWECDTHPKVICQKTQTCCRKLTNDPANNELISTFQCFEGINQICCGSRGVCAEDEYCNPILSKCENIKSVKDLAEKQVEENMIKEQRLDFLFENTQETNTNQKSNNELEKLENALPNIPLEMDDLLRFDYPKIWESIPYLLQEFKDLKCCSFRNLTIFADGFMSGLRIFESAYRNTTCEEDIRQVTRDWSDFFDIINSIKYDETIFKKLHQAVDQLEIINEDYHKKRKDCVPTWHKLACIMKRVLDRILDPEFPRELADHSICNYHELKNRTNWACCALKRHKYHEAGYRFGDTFKFFMFWDFNGTISKNDNPFLADLDECGI